MSGDSQEGGSDCLRLLKPRDVAALLGVSEKTLGEWRARGRGPAFLRFDRTIRYQQEAIRRFQEEAAVETLNTADRRSVPPENDKKQAKTDGTIPKRPKRAKTGEMRAR